MSRRVSTIIQYNLKVLINPLIKQYWNYITPYQKRKVRAWLRELIDNRFSFDIFKALVSSDAKVEKRDIVHLKEYLTSIIQTQKNTAETNAVKVLTDSNPYDDLIQVGYWCFINILKRDDFREFVGIDNSFDFYFLYDKYDFSKFDVSMILSRHKNALDLIAKNTFVRTKIREAIAVALKSNGLSDRDERDLREILMNHFC